MSWTAEAEQYANGYRPDPDGVVCDCRDGEIAAAFMAGAFMSAFGIGVGAALWAIVRWVT